MKALARIAVVAALLVAIGCGGGTAPVAGKVTFQGKRVVFGTVVVIGTDGIPKSGPIQPDGTYRVAGVKVGPAKVAVSSPPPPGVTLARKAPRGGREDDDGRAAVDGPVNPEVAKNWFPIPNKYGDPEKSGLTAEVKPGQPVDIDLK